MAVCFFFLKLAEHISKLYDVFQRLNDASLTLKFLKCECGKAAAWYLVKETESNRGEITIYRYIESVLSLGMNTTQLSMEYMKEQSGISQFFVLYTSA